MSQLARDHSENVVNLRENIHYIILNDFKGGLSKT